MSRLTIGQLAKRTGVGVETIRFYERQGLIPEPERLASGYRHYPPEAIGRVRFIRQAQHLGFSLKEVLELLSLQDDPNAGRAEVRNKVVAKLGDIKRRIQELETIQSDLSRMIGACDGIGSAATCPILHRLSEEPGTT
ncbi:MAG: MerR family transcriptional regulator [Gemmataceae bacterium]